MTEPILRREVTVTVQAPKRACPDNCREFVHDPEATDD